MPLRGHAPRHVHKRGPRPRHPTRDGDTEMWAVHDAWAAV